jgi:hypothetical protein
MGKKCGLRMAQGGLLGPKVMLPRPGAPIVTSGIRGAIGMAEGGIVRGKGGPTDDEVPMQVAGKNVNLSNTEAVLPAKTVQALGGPEAVEELIEQTNGKPPVRGGLREGGEYELGATGEEKKYRAPISPSSTFPGAHPAAGKNIYASQTPAPAVANKHDYDPMTVGQPSEMSPTLSNAALPNAIKKALTYSDDREALKAKNAAVTAQATTTTPASPTLSDAVGINVKGMSPEQRSTAADTYSNYVDQQTGVGPINNRGDGSINYGGMRQRIDAYGKDPGLLAARNAREDLLGSGIRMGVDGKGGLTINNTGDRSNGTLAAAGGTTMDMKGANEIYARANAIRGSIGADNGGPVGGVAVLGGGSGISDERAALLKAATTAHPGAQNGQLTLGQMSTARGLMGDVQGERIKAQELAASSQRAAMDNKSKQQELGLRAQEAASMDAYRNGSLRNDAQKNAAAAKSAAQANYLALSKDQREVMDGYVKKMIPTDGLKDGDLKAAQKGQAEMTEAIMKAAGGRLPLDPQELQSVLPQLIDQGRLTLNERDAALNPSLGDRLNNLMGGNVEREGSMYAKNTVTLSNGNIVQVGKNGKVVGPELDPRKVYGRNADLREAAEQRREQFAAQQ